MNPLTINDPADLLSFIGHTLGFWPQESLVCITLDNNKVGATLRIDLPSQPGHELLYARTVASYLINDDKATSMVFALYTATQSEPGKPKPHAATIAALTGVLAENGMTIRDGIFVGNDTYSPYDTEPGHDIALPLSSTEYSQVNAEFIYRGSTIAPTSQIILPPRAKQAEEATAVEIHMTTIKALHPKEALRQAHHLWKTMLNAGNYPSDDDPSPSSRTSNSPTSATAHSRHPRHQRTTPTHPLRTNRDCPEVVAHRMGPTTPPTRLHKNQPQTAAILTTIGYINWWEGRGSKAHQYMQLALETDPGYRFARLTDQMLGASIIAGWNTNKNTAYKTRLDRP
jgi:hypothetical protein